MMVKILEDMTPLTIQVTVENEAELSSLYHRLKIPVDVVQDASSKGAMVDKISTIPLYNVIKNILNCWGIKSTNNKN